MKQTYRFSPITLPPDWNRHTDHIEYMIHFGPSDTPDEDARVRTEECISRFETLVNEALLYFGHEAHSIRRVSLVKKLERLSNSVESDSPNTQYACEMSVFIKAYQALVKEYRRVCRKSLADSWLYEFIELCYWLNKSRATLHDDLCSRYGDFTPSNG